MGFDNNTSCVSRVRSDRSPHDATETPSFIPSRDEGTSGGVARVFGEPTPWRRTATLR